MACIKSSMRWAWNVACMWKKRAAYRVLVGKPMGKRPLGKPKRGWEDKMDLQEVGWGEGTRLIWLRTGTGDGLL